MEIPVQTRVAKFFRSRKEGLEFFLLFLLVAAAFLVRIWGISKTHFWDEMVYLQNAQVICCGKINYSELDYRPPLLSLISAGCFRSGTASMQPVLSRRFSTLSARFSFISPGACWWAACRQQLLLCCWHSHPFSWASFLIDLQVM